LTLSSNGAITGTPTTTGIFNFTVTATDANGCAGAQGYTINVVCGAITLTSPPLPNGTLGVPYSTTITASGGTAPYTFAVSVGSTPPGITLASDGSLSGTPVSAGSFPFTVTATDALGCMGSQTYTLIVSALLFDDFEDGVFTWNVLKGSWSESGGNLIGTGTGKITAFAPLPWDPSGVSGCATCAIQVDDVVVASGASARIIGWFADNHNKVDLILKEGKVTLKQRVAGATVVKVSASATITAGVPFDVELSFDGSNFAVLVDGNLVLTAPASSTPSGKVGLSVKNGTATFGEIRVE
jgi:hypothetical protein